MSLNTPTGTKLRESGIPAWIFTANDDGTLSGGEVALAKIVRVLSAEFDALDGTDQEAVATALGKVAQETLSAEQWAKKHLGL